MEDGGRLENAVKSYLTCLPAMGPVRLISPDTLGQADCEGLQSMHTILLLWRYTVWNSRTVCLTMSKGGDTKLDDGPRSLRRDLQLNY